MADWKVQIILRCVSIWLLPGPSRSSWSWWINLLDYLSNFCDPFFDFVLWPSIYWFLWLLFLASRLCFDWFFSWLLILFCSLLIFGTQSPNFYCRFHRTFYVAPIVHHTKTRLERIEIWKFTLYWYHISYLGHQYLGSLVSIQHIPFQICSFL